jgi:hypothetical protein
MKAERFKQLLKEAVREVFQEEIKDLLREAIVSPKPVMTEAVQTRTTVDTGKSTSNIATGLRDSYRSLMQDGFETETPMFTTQHLNTPRYTPPPGTATFGEGSALPPGEVDLSQIAGFLTKS